MKHIGTLGLDRHTGPIDYVDTTTGAEDIHDQVVPVAMDFVEKAEAVARVTEEIDNLDENEARDARGIMTNLIRMRENPEYVGCFPDDDKAIWDAWLEKCFIINYLGSEDEEACLREFRRVAEQHGRLDNFELMVSCTNPHYQLPQKSMKIRAGESTGMRLPKAA